MRPMPELPGVSHRFVDAGGVRLHVAEAGAGEPVVMLHGWPEHWWTWRKLIPGLAEHYRVICPDLRGFGWSDAPRRGYEKEQFAADVAELLDSLGLHDVRLVGHDWGGVAGFILCVRRPDLVSRYLALNTGHLWPRVERSGARNLHRFAYQWVIAAPGLGRAAVGRARAAAGGARTPDHGATRGVVARGRPDHAGPVPGARARLGQRADLPQLPAARDRPAAARALPLAAPARAHALAARAERRRDPAGDAARATSPTPTRSGWSW